MRKEFQSFRKIDEKLSKKIWDDALFVFDTNVLLNLYRYPSDVAEELMETISIFKNKIWMPHNVALEFYKNRLKVIAHQRKKITDLKSKLFDSLNNAESFINNSDLEKKHSHVKPNDIIDILKEAREKIDVKISHFSDQQIDVHEEDKICNRLEELYHKKVGDPFESQEELDKLYELASKRYEKGMPPGYKDKYKDEEDGSFFHNGICYNNAFGDYLLWFQILEHFKNEKKTDLIFVTDDAKEDWWHSIKSPAPKIIGPRRELVEEFIQTTGSPNFLMYNSLSFLKLAKERAGAKITENSIEAVKNLTERSERKKALQQLSIRPSSDFTDEYVKFAVANFLLGERPDAQLERSDDSFDFVLTDDSTRSAVKVVRVEDFSRPKTFINALAAAKIESSFMDHDETFVFFVGDEAVALRAVVLERSIPPNVSVLFGTIENDTFEPKAPPKRGPGFSGEQWINRYQNNEWVAMRTNRKKKRNTD